MSKIKKIGVQLFTIRKFIKTKEEMANTFKRIKGMGYDELYINGGGDEYKLIVDSAKNEGLELIGTTYNLKTIMENTDDVLDNCRYSGSYSVGIYKEVTYSKELYEKLCENINETGKIISQSGAKLLYNHHAREFCKMEDGKRGMEMLKSLTNPQYLSFSLNTFWMQNAGVDIRHFISEFGGRIEILRMQDTDIAMDYLRGNAPVGSGNMYWDGIIEVAQKANVKHYIVEDEKFLGNLFDALEKSSDFIHKHYM